MGPSPVRIVVQTASAIGLEWYDRSRTEDGYRIYRSSGGRAEVLVAELGPQQGWNAPYPYVDAGLAPDRLHCYRVVPFLGRREARAFPVCGYTDRREPAGRRVARLRLLTHNVYGFDDGGVLGGPGLPWGFLDNHCEERAEAFGESVALADPPFDIVGLQEYYSVTDFDTKTCDAGPLRNAIASTGLYTSSAQRFLFQPRGEPYEGEADGGIGLFTTHTIAQAQSFEWGWTPWLWESPVQGILFARIDLAGAQLAVDVYVAHLYPSSDGCDEACKQEAFDQLAARIALHSGSSGNPVVVMGDLNIGPAGSLYPYMQAALGAPRDLWRENHPEDPGYTKDGCWSGLPEDCLEGGQNRLDYILVPTSPALTSSPYEVFVRNRDDVQVVVWSDGFGIHVSDHYGVEATIELWERPVAVNPAGAAPKGTRAVAGTSAQAGRFGRARPAPAAARPAGDPRTSGGRSWSSGR